MSGTTEHIFSVDVEEYFQVHAFEGIVRRTEWPTLPSRIERNVDTLLELLARHDVSATFFVLGWIADQHPGIVRRIADSGHEIASHGWWHYRVTALDPAEFRTDVRTSKAILEDVSGQPVVGYRAPSFSIIPGCEHAFDILLEEGYTYDSSLFPFRRRGYGYAGAPPIPHVIRRPTGRLLEFPLTTCDWAGLRIPAAGGGYFRQFPYSLIRRAFRQRSLQQVPAVFYIHPWELDPDQPRFPVGPLTRVRHYRGLKRTVSRLERLLAEFRFTSVSRCLASRRPSVELDMRAPVLLS
jgi:polysaccharide deacetylase family protein (PEP-CTERM system associated)